MFVGQLGVVLFTRAIRTRSRVRRHADHTEPRVPQHIHDALLDEGLVLADDHPNLRWRTHAPQACPARCEYLASG